MEIFYLGQTCFKIKTKEITVAIDPLDAKFVTNLPKADIVCLTQEGASLLSESDSFIIDGPGEYEIKGVSVFGVPAVSGKNADQKPITIYLLEIEDFKLAHLGSIGRKLNNEQLAELEGVDVLMVPVGGGGGAGPKKAAEIVGQLTPSIVIPMLYVDSTKLEKFFEAMEEEMPEAVEKLKLKSRGDLPEETEVILLNV